jgi:hypothetical protein
VKELMSDKEKKYFTTQSFTEEEKEILAEYKMNELKQLCKQKNVDVSKLTKKNLKITWARAYFATQN